MEGTVVIKSVVLAANQYVSANTQENLVILLRQLDVLTGMTSRGKSLKFFCPTQMVATECLSSLLDLLMEVNTPVDLALKTMVLLFNLAADSEICETLQVTYNLPATLAACVHVYTNGKNPEQPEHLILQCLQLLQKITYNYKIAYPNSYAEDLIRFLVIHVIGTESDLTLPCLGLLANLCRNNISIQAHIKALDNVKTIYKKLIQCLSHSSQAIIVFSLSVLSSLCLNEALGDRLFNAKNISQTFELIFNILVKSDSIITRRYAVDLVVDILKHPHIRQSFILYEHFPVCLEQILKLLTTLQADAVSKIFELLLAFSSMNELRVTMCRSLMMTSNLQALDQSIEPARLAQSEPYFAAINWAMQDIDVHETAPLKALGFLTEVYEELLDSSMTEISPRLDIIIPVATGQLVCPAETEGAMLRPRYKKLGKAINLCLVLCGDEGVRSEVVRLLDVSTCFAILEHQLNHNRIGLNLNKSGDNEVDWSEAGAETVLLMTDLLLKLQPYSTELQQPLQQLLQDQRLMPFLAHALTGSVRQQVQVALQITTAASTLQQFPTIILGECIASNNTHKTDEIETLRRPMNPAPEPIMPFSENRPPLSSLMSNGQTKNTRLSDSNIQGLIDKMKTGMDLKDARASEIMDVYEHKLTSLATKESHLQDLLEAKALALAQADRLIAQYRCRRAQSEAEARKLRSVLKDSERRSEDYREQLQHVSMERDNLAGEFQKSSTEVQRLRVIASEHEQLVVNHAETSKRLNSVESTLSTTTAEYQALQENHQMLTRHTDELQTKYNVTVETLEKQVEELRGNLKESESQLSQVSERLRYKEDQLEKEREELDTALDGLRSELEKSKQKRKELGEKVTALESDCRKQKKDIREKDVTLRAQKAELDKHSQLTQMIHSLTNVK